MHNYEHQHNNHDFFHNHKKKKFIIVIFINLLISVIEIVAGIISGSIALISDAFHNLEDTASLIISYVAWIFSLRSPDIRRTYGYKRIEIIAAFVNSIFLTGICIFIIFESIKRFLKPQLIDANIMMIISFIAFLINIVSAYLLHGESKDSINWGSSYWHLVGDAFFSFAIFGGSIVIKKWGLYYIDPLISIIMSFFIIYQAFLILKKSFNILTQGGAEIDYDLIKKEVEGVEGVKNIHHIHSWYDNEHTIYFEAHIEVNNMSISDGCKIYEKVNEILKRHKIYHSTLQLETDICKDKDIINKHIR